MTQTVDLIPRRITYLGYPEPVRFDVCETELVTEWERVATLSAFIPLYDVKGVPLQVTTNGLLGFPFLLPLPAQVQ